MGCSALWPVLIQETQHKLVVFVQSRAKPRNLQFFQPLLTFGPSSGRMTIRKTARDSSETRVGDCLALKRGC